MTTRRHIAWIGASDRRVTCACGHVFTPDARVLRGSGSVRCLKCRGLSLILAPRGNPWKCVVQVTESELGLLETMDAEQELAYLMSAPLPDLRSA